MLSGSRMLDTLSLWQALCLMGLALQHADQSLYEVPVSNIRATSSQYSHM